MLIVILAAGTRGDVQPAIALGVGLRARGHRVRLFVGAEFGTWVASHGLEVATASFAIREMMQSPIGRAWAEEGTNPLRQVRLMKALIDAFPAATDDAWAACQGADAIIGSFTTDVYATSIAEKLGVPQLSAWLQPPFVPTREGTATNNAPLPGRRSVLNALFTRFAVEPVMWRLYGAQDARLRREILGLPPQGWSRVRSTLARTPKLLGYSRHVVPHPPDWPATLHTTGYWFLDEGRDWTPPPDLARFLAADSPPVYIGFGSMTAEDAPRLTRLIVEAVGRAGVRAVLHGGWAGLGSGELPPAIFPLDAAPHEWLFPRLAAVVHHGGAGTTAAGLRAGIPTVTVPHLGDQPFWGRRVAELGAGPRPIPKGRLTAERLAAAIRQAVDDPVMRQRAGALGAAIRAEDGIATAVTQIERVLGGPRGEGV